MKAADITEWHGPCTFMPHDDGRRASLQAWAPSKRPAVGAVIGLRDRAGRLAAYRVTEHAPSHMAADYDGWIIRLEFIPGREIEP